MDALTRLFILSVGCFAIVWFLFAGPIFFTQAAAEKTARSIASGQSFKAELIAPLMEQSVGSDFGKWTRPSAFHNLAVVQLWFLERSFSGNDPKNVDGLMRSTDWLIRRAIVNAPTDSLLWLVWFWLESTRNGFSKNFLNYLEMSYLVGPNEGWIGVKRSRFSVAVYPALSPKLAENAIAEFARLVDSGYVTEAADILGGPGWFIRDKLVSRLEAVAEINRQAFDKAVFRRGYDISIPGVERQEWRPWQ